MDTEDIQLGPKFLSLLVNRVLIPDLHRELVRDICNMTSK